MGILGNGRYRTIAYHSLQLLYIPYILHTMNAPLHTRTFKSGNSIAVRLPKRLGIAADTELEIVRQGRDLVLRRVVDPAAEQAQLRQLVARLREIGPVDAVDERDPDIFPDRAGLY